MRKKLHLYTEETPLLCGRNSTYTRKKLHLYTEETPLIYTVFTNKNSVYGIVLLIIPYILAQNNITRTMTDTKKELKRVAQHNNLIKAEFDFSTTEVRIFLHMLNQIKIEDTDFSLMKIPISMITSSKGGNTIKEMRKIQEVIVTKKLIVENIVKDKKGNDKLRTKVFSIIPTCNYIEGEGYLEARFNNDAKEYLLNLKEDGNFTQSEFDTLRTLKSYYSHRIYWLLKQYTFKGYRELTVTSLRRMMKLEEKYPKFNDFKKFVINIAQQELEHTDMAFSYSLVKKGREIDTIVFTINNAKIDAEPTVFNQPPAPTPETIQAEEDLKLKAAITKLKDWGLSNQQINKILAKVAHNDIYRTNYPMQSYFHNNPAVNKAAYVWTAYCKAFDIK
jgi:plasmid replication initiation protein